MDSSIFSLQQGRIPLLISMPHIGTELPADIAQHMTPTAQILHDTDWHLDRLYDFAKEMGASLLMPTHSRYVIDLNRPPNDENLYPGQSTTGLLPSDTFDAQDLYLEGCFPDEDEKIRRRELYWQPYHQALSSEIARIKAEHGYVLLWEAHSIRAYIPRLFEGRLPDFNFGSASDHSAKASLAQHLADIVDAQSDYSSVANGRFKGGYITRHYGDPAQNVHAIQLELAQLCYMEERPPYAYDEVLAERLQPVLKMCLEQALAYIQAE